MSLLANKEVDDPAKPAETPRLEAKDGVNADFVLPPRPKPTFALNEKTPALFPVGIGELQVGEGVSFSGKVIAADKVLIGGFADGEIDARSVEILPTGSLNGSVKAEHLIVAGALTGEADVIGDLFVKSTGTVDGKIAYGRLSVEEGGNVLGVLEKIKGGGRHSDPDNESVVPENNHQDGKI